MVTCVQNENSAIKANPVGPTRLILSSLHYATRCQNKCSTYQRQGEMHRGCLWLFGSLIWMWHTLGARPAGGAAGGGGRGGPPPRAGPRPPRAHSRQRLLLSLSALTHTSHHSAGRCPGASPVRTHQTLPWAPEPCSGSSNPIIAGLTVIANIGDTLTWSERMKTSTVKVKRGRGVGVLPGMGKVSNIWHKTWADHSNSVFCNNWY